MHPILTILQFLKCTYFKAYFLIIKSCLRTKYIYCGRICTSLDYVWFISHIIFLKSSLRSILIHHALRHLNLVLTHLYLSAIPSINIYIFLICHTRMHFHQTYFLKIFSTIIPSNIYDPRDLHHELNSVMQGLGQQIILSTRLVSKTCYPVLVANTTCYHP